MSTHEGSMTGNEQTLSPTTSGPFEEKGRDLGRKADALSARVQTEVRSRAHDVGEIGQKVQERVTTAKDKVAHGVHDGRVRVEFEVQAHPVRTLLYAAGAGLLIGMLLGRRSRR